MTEINRSTLFGKLNPIAYRSIEGATVFCKLRGNPYVELQHWLAQILQVPDSASLLLLERLTHLDDGRPVDLAKIDRVTELLTEG